MTLGLLLLLLLAPHAAAATTTEVTDGSCSAVSDEVRAGGRWEEQRQGRAVGFVACHSCRPSV
jgi:hypothetical protein